MKKIFLLIVTIGFVGNLLAQNKQPKFDAIYKREIPKWFNEAKFGIFVVWGPYSVPSYKPSGYAEWYWKNSQVKGASKDFHNRVYGEKFKYSQFAEKLTAELWDPELWCELFEKSGAKYVVTTANYHDGFAMYPTKYAETIETKAWNSTLVGPKRDIIGELNLAGNKRGLKMGIYYSLTEWYHPWWDNQREKFVDEWLHPKFKEVVTKYKPWHIFLDGDWMSYKNWKSEELANWLYTESVVKDVVVTNDRWGKPARGSYGDVFESEYGGGKFTSPEHPWQEDRGIGTSYGYNRMENIYDYDSRDELIQTFSGVVGGGGNFLLCVGPTADGRIPVIMQERLLQVGDWLKINGEAIYGANASPFWPRTFGWGTISKKAGKLFLHIQNSEIGSIKLEGIDAIINSAKILTENGKIPVDFKNKKEKLSLKWPAYLNDKAVTIIELDVAENYKVDKTQRQFSNGVVEFNCRAMQSSGNKATPYYHGISNRLWMADWTDPKEKLSIDLIINKPGRFNLDIIYAATSKNGKYEVKSPVGGSYKVKIGLNELSSIIENTKSDSNPESKNIGTINIQKSGTYKLTVEPIDNGKWNGFRFQGIKLTPIE